MERTTTTEKLFYSILLVFMSNTIILSKMAEVGQESRARQPTRAVDIHGAGPAYSFAARSAEGMRRINLHRTTIIESDMKRIETRVVVAIVAHR